MQSALGREGGEFCLERVGVNSSLNAIRGYGKAPFHSLSRACSKTAFRRTEQFLELSNLDVGAVRVSASGWEAWVLEGLQVQLLLHECGERVARSKFVSHLQTLKEVGGQVFGHLCPSGSHPSVLVQGVLQRPAVHVILLEIYPRLLLDSGYSGRASVVLQRAQEWGFTNATHMG